jgi:hypothetical protein
MIALVFESHLIDIRKACSNFSRFLNLDHILHKLRVQLISVRLYYNITLNSETKHLQYVIQPRCTPD